MSLPSPMSFGVPASATTGPAESVEAASDDAGRASPRFSKRASMGVSDADTVQDAETVLGDLTKAASGDVKALGRVMPLVYARVREIAGTMLAHDRARRWVQASSLVQRAVLRLMATRDVDLKDQARVTAVLATIMRRIVVDIVRERQAVKRGGNGRAKDHAAAERANGADGGGGGEFAYVSLHSNHGPANLESAATRVDALEVEDALVALSAINAKAARVAEMRLWGAMKLEQIVLATGWNIATVRRRWKTAKAWLDQDLRREREGRCEGAGRVAQRRKT